MVFWFLSLEKKRKEEERGGDELKSLRLHSTLPAITDVGIKQSVELDPCYQPLGLIAQSSFKYETRINKRSYYYMLHLL